MISGSRGIHHPAECELFEGALSCELLQPAEFRPGSAAGRQSAAESLLRSLAQIEDSRGEGLGDERSELPPATQRMEAKLDLMMILVSRLVRQHEDTLPLRPVRWSRRGIRLETGVRTAAAPGAAGVLCLQPSEWLPEKIELPVTLLSEAASGSGGFFLWLKFADLGAGLEAAMERHLFRLHRRQIADARHER